MGAAPDLTDKFNTKLTPEEETKFQQWAAAQGRAGDTSDYDLRGAWKANAQEASNGHLPDTFKKPNHPTFSNESKYNGADGAYGGRWVGDDKTGWKFEASDHNLKNMSPEELQQYFQKVEPGVQLVLPKSRVDKYYPPAASTPPAQAPN